MNAVYMRLVTVSSCLVFLCGTAASAQQQPQAVHRRVAVRVVVPMHAGSDHDVLVTRRARDGGYTIVLPRNAATPENLFAGALAVTGLMERDGDSRRDETIRRVPATTRAPRREVLLGRQVLARLQTSEPRHVHGVGSARITHIYMPDQASREAAISAGKRRSVLDRQ